MTKSNYIAGNAGAVVAAGASGLLGAECVGQGLGGLRVLHHVAAVSGRAVGRLDDLILHRAPWPAAHDIHQLLHSCN